MRKIKKTWSFSHQSFLLPSFWQIVYGNSLQYLQSFTVKSPTRVNLRNVINKLQIKSHRMQKYNHWRCSVRKGILRNFTKFTGKYLCYRIYFHKVAGLRPATSLNKWLSHKCFPVNFARFLRTPFLENTSGWLLLCMT